MYLNRDRATGIMRDAGLDALVATHLRNVTYFSDYPQLHECTPAPTAYAVLPADPSTPSFLVVRTASLSIIRQEKCWVQDTELYAAPAVCLPDDLKPGRLTPDERLLYEASLATGMPAKPVQALRLGLERRGMLTGRIGVDESGLPQPRGWEEIVEGLAGASIQPAASLISKIRLVKTEPELRLLEQAAAINDAGLKACLAGIRSGATEVEAAAAYHRGVWRRGGIPHYANLGYGRRSALRNCFPAAVKPRRGDIVKLDFDCIYRGYFADIGRTGCIGTPSAKIRRYYAAVLTALEEVKAATRPGVKPSALFRLAIEAVRKGGIPYFDLSYIGHAIGMWCYDGLAVGPMEDRPLETNMVLNLEPSHYELGLGALHAEDTVVVTPIGYRSLQRSSFRLVEL